MVGRTDGQISKPGLELVFSAKGRVRGPCLELQPQLGAGQGERRERGRRVERES